MLGLKVMFVSIGNLKKLVLERVFYSGINSSVRYLQTIIYNKNPIHIIYLYLNKFIKPLRDKIVQQLPKALDTIPCRNREENKSNSTEIPTTKYATICTCSYTSLQRPGI
jgi:hypothetical protein